MKKILIATHGYLADGFKSSLAILSGKQDSAEYVNAYVDESDYTPRIRAFVESVGPDDEGVIFTDIYGGSVFQKVVLEMPVRDNIFHVTGVNLGLVIEVLLTSEPITSDYLESVIEMARRGMQLVIPQGVSSARGGSDSADGFFD